MHTHHIYMQLQNLDMQVLERSIRPWPVPGPIATSHSRLTCELKDYVHITSTMAIRALSYFQGTSTAAYIYIYAVT